MNDHSSNATTSEDLSATDRHFLNQVFELAELSKANGRHPFAAIVVDGDGNLVVARGNNSMPPEGDPTQHAERVAAAEAARLLTPGELRKSTLYTNAEPCAMCSGAIYWCNIGRVVYPMSEQDLLKLTGNHPENPTLSMPCRQVFASGQRKVEVIGPIEEYRERAAEPHIGFWK